jgi:membrane-associated protein
MDFFSDVWHVLTNINENLERWVGLYGTRIYIILALIIFCETGLVVMPFLPGDSLLFAAGALTSGMGEKLSLGVLCIVLPIAAILGDNLNYAIGRALGPKVFSKPKSRIFNPATLLKTQAFYTRHGRKTILLARFIPLMRTFAPFVAGVGRMDYPRFLGYSILGAFIWVIVCAGAGHLFGNFPIVKENFELVIVGVIAISILMPLLGWWKARRSEREDGGANP